MCVGGGVKTFSLFFCEIKIYIAKKKLYSIKFAILTIFMQEFLVYSQFYATVITKSRTFSIFQKERQYPFSKHSAFFPPISLWPLLIFCLCEFASSGHSYKWNHTVSGLLCLASFI